MKNCVLGASLEIRADWPLCLCISDLDIYHSSDDRFKVEPTIVEGGMGSSGKKSCAQL